MDSSEAKQIRMSYIHISISYYQFKMQFSEELLNEL